MPARMEHWIKQHPLLTFFGLAYALRWTFEIPALLLAQRAGLSLSNEDNLIHFFRLVQLQLTAAEAFPFILFLIAAGPLFAALIVTAVIEGRAGLRDLGRRIVRWRVSPRWYLIVLALPLLLSAASLAAGPLLGGLGGFTLKLPLSYFVPFLLFMMIFTGLAEEPGWRGFALPHLQRRWSAETSSWILGVMWGLWHLPFTVYYNRANHPLVLIPALIMLTVGVVGWTIVNTWIYNNTESVFLVIVLHGWNNAVQSYLILSSQNLLVNTLYGLLPWAIAIVLLRVYGKQNLARSPRPMAGRGPAEHPRHMEGQQPAAS